MKPVVLNILAIMYLKSKKVLIFLCEIHLVLLKFFMLCASNITILGHPVLIFHRCAFWIWFFPKNQASSSAWCGFAWVSSCCGWAPGDMQSPTWSSSHLQTFTTNWTQGRSCLSSSIGKVCHSYFPGGIQWNCFEVDFLFARVCAKGNILTDKLLFPRLGSVSNRLPVLGGAGKVSGGSARLRHTSWEGDRPHRSASVTVFVICRMFNLFKKEREREKKRNVN